jgi:hypothetical protein
VDEPLVAARTLVAEVFPRARWAMLAGSVLTNHRTAGSDLDIVVLLPDGAGAPCRRSLVWHGWPVDLFMHDAASLEHFIALNLAERKPSTPRMCATGVLVTAPDPHAEEARVRCAAALAAGPSPLDRPERERWRYVLTDLLDDLTHGRDPAEQIVITTALWLDTAELALHDARHWIGRGKWLVRELRDLDPVLAARWVAAHGDSAAVATLAAEVLEAAGGPLFDGYQVGGPVETGRA